MEIIIVRQEHKPWGIDGHLYINRQRVCDTVEHPTRHLPAGEYSVVNDKAYAREFQAFNGLDNARQKILITNDDIDYSTSTVRHIPLRSFLEMETL